MVQKIITPHEHSVYEFRITVRTYAHPYIHSKGPFKASNIKILNIFNIFSLNNSKEEI